MNDKIIEMLRGGTLTKACDEAKKDNSLMQACCGLSLTEFTSAAAKDGDNRKRNYSNEERLFFYLFVNLYHYISPVDPEMYLDIFY